MKIHYFKTLLILIHLAVFSREKTLSQTKQIDSLKFLLANTKEDSNKVNIFFELSKRLHTYKTVHLDISYADSALRLSKKLNFIEGVFKSLNRIGSAVLLNNDYKQAIRYYSEAAAIAEQLEDKKKIAEVYGYIGYAYTTQYNYPEAFHYSFKSLKIHEETGNKYRQAKMWLSIGTLYTNLGNQQEAGLSYTRALKLFEESQEKTSRDIATCYHFIGRSSLLLGNYAKALRLFEDALKIWLETNNKSFIAGTTTHIGLTNIGIGDSALRTGNKELCYEMYKKALANFYSAMHVSEALADTEGIAAKYNEIARINVFLKDFSAARNNLNNALQLAQNLPGRDLHRDIYQTLATLDSAVGNYRAAYLNYRLFIKYRDSVINEGSQKKIDYYRMEYDFNKKEDSLKQKQFITETKLSIEKKQKYFYWAGLALLTLLSFFVFLNFRNQKKINRLATEAYAKERSELELQSLRAQLNPHFIFNCINSIDAFIHSNDKYNATVYLNKFARLLRNILDSSKLNTVSFEKDMDTLKLYVELEELRYENKFRTEFNIDKELLNSDYKVPALIIQPFVENAILHGLKNREDNNGLLQVEIRKAADKIEYLVKDNGIGRKAAAAISQNKESSYGMQMSNDRIKLFNREEKPSVQINDLFNDGVAAGTEVKVCLNII